MVVMGDSGRGGSLTLSGRILGPDALNDIILTARIEIWREEWKLLENNIDKYGSEKGRNRRDEE